MESGKDAENQPVLFMGAQTENLDYMYELVHELSAQLKTNENMRDAVLQDVDLLSRQLNHGNVDVSPDINVTKQFIYKRLKDEELSIQDEEEEDGNEEDNMLHHVTKQNEQLKEILKNQQRRNAVALQALRHHDEGLEICVTMLRNEIYSYHVTVLSRSRGLIENQLYKAEDSQFNQYLESVTDLQQLLDLCKLYRTLLRAHP